jgi:signal transduction histidine kinase
MKATLLAAIAVTMLVTGAHQALAQSGQDLFQQALVKERADGQLQDAIALYERIVRESSGDRELAARALVQMGGVTRSWAIAMRKGRTSGC